MKKILLLGPGAASADGMQRWQVDMHQLQPTDRVDIGAYAAVVVVNDGGARAAQRMLAACAMRERQHNLRIGVLSYVGEQHRPNPPAGLEQPLRLELEEEGVRLEYQAP